MTVARDLGAFVSRCKAADLPAKALEHAAMLISSTIASAALGSTLESAKIIRKLELERGGRPDATLWFGAQRLSGDGEAQWTLSDDKALVMLRDGSTTRRRFRARAPGKATVTIALGDTKTTVELEVVP